MDSKRYIDIDNKENFKRGNGYQNGDDKNPFRKDNDENFPPDQDEINFGPKFRMTREKMRDLKKKRNERIDRDIKGRKVRITKKVESIIGVQRELQESNGVKKRLKDRLDKASKSLVDFQVHMERVFGVMMKGKPKDRGRYKVLERELRKSVDDLDDVLLTLEGDIEDLE